MGSDLKENRVIKKTVCNMCNVRCGLDVHVQDGRILTRSSGRDSGRALGLGDLNPRRLIR